MEMSPEQQNSPDVRAQQQANKLIRLIRKLRWMGMEEEGCERADRAGAVRRQAYRQRANGIARDRLT
jgi:hypothetical protein